MKSKSIPNPYARKILIATRLNPDEMRETLSKAQVYFDGNISVLIREALKSFKAKAKR